MLLELRVENLLLLHRAELRLAPGLNVLTGETGAGKTLLAHALDLLLGGRARSGIVRAGAAEAYVEGVFSAPGRSGRARRRARAPRTSSPPTPRSSCWRGGCGRTGAPAPTCAGARPPWPTCASSAPSCSPSTASTSTASSCSPPPSSTSSTPTAARPSGLAGRRSAAPTSACADSRPAWPSSASSPGPASASSICSPSSSRRSRPRRPSEEEAHELEAERERLRHVETLRAAAAGGAEAIAPETGAGVAELLGGTLRALEQAAAIDSQLTGPAERAAALLYEAQDLGAELRAYVDGIEAPPGRLEEVEERLGVLRAPGAQARRQHRRGARPRRALPGPAGRARGRRGGARGRRRPSSPRREPSSSRWPASCASVAGRPRPPWPRRCGRAWPSWPCPRRSSPSSSPSGRAAAGRGAPTPSSC